MISQKADYNLHKVSITINHWKSKMGIVQWHNFQGHHCILGCFIVTLTWIRITIDLNLYYTWKA